MRITFTAALAIAVAGAIAAPSVRADCGRRGTLDDLDAELARGALVLRHADTEQRRGEWVLTHTGQRQAEALGMALGRALKQESVLLFHSNRTRATQTALAIAKGIESVSRVNVSLQVREKLAPSALERFLASEGGRSDIVIYVEHSETINPLLGELPSVRCAESVLFRVQAGKPVCVARYETEIPSTNPACRPS